MTMRRCSKTMVSLMPRFLENYVEISRKYLWSAVLVFDDWTAAMQVEQFHVIISIFRWLLIINDAARRRFLCILRVCHFCFHLKEDTERTMASLADCCAKGRKNEQRTKENSCMDAALGVRVGRGCSVPIGGVLYGLVCRTVLRLNRRWPLAAVRLMRDLAFRRRLGGLPRSNSNAADEQSHVCFCCHRTLGTNLGL